MKAKIYYELMLGSSELMSKEARKAGQTAWHIYECVEPEMGETTKTPVAIFNFNTEAERFAGHVVAEGLDGKLLRVEKNLADALKELAGYKAKWAVEGR